ncbi:SIMPL domain-containing protein [Brevundimonas sp.]|uniref:SIMPL domain-containing protein n=1 Tax=Brevundimonas sp. TaxID=1871086 RepID=UPI002FD8A7AE
MKTPILFLAFSAVAFPAAAQTAPTERPTIAVIGVGRAEAMPDTFRMSAKINGRGDDQVSALRALAETQRRVSDGIQLLDGLSGLVVTTSQTSVSPTYDLACSKDHYDDSNCPITGYIAAIDLFIKGAPISVAGNAMSLVSERGAESVTVEAFDLGERGELEAEAGRRAFVDARRQAEVISTASGQRIVRVLRVQVPDNRMGGVTETGEVEDVVVTASRARPSVDISLSPAPIAAEKRLSVTFEIE